MPTNPKTERNLRRPPTSAPPVAALASLATILIFAFSRLAGATTVNAKSASFSDVTAAIASAADGDTVTIPGGTASWTRTLRVKRGITIQGAGVGVTIIKDNVQSGSLIQWTLAAGQVSCMTGIEFQDGGGVQKSNGVLVFIGSNTNGSHLRIHHCQFTDINGPIYLDTIIGVIDHCTQVHNLRNSTYKVAATYWNGDTGGFGDASWADATQFGSGNFLFIEDCTYNNIAGGSNQPSISDSINGARFVVRHCTITGNGTVQTHGTESSGRYRGNRALEVYNVTFSGTNVNKFIGGLRSGVALFHDCTASGYLAGITQFATNEQRVGWSFDGFGGADGVTNWDLNSGPFGGTFTAATVGSSTCTVSGTPWTTNQLVGYTVRKDNTTASTPYFAEISGNTANSVTWTYGKLGTMTMSVGDTFKIYHVDQCLDGCGRAKGAQPAPVISPPPPPVGWNTQVTEPCYAWNNVTTDSGKPVQQIGFVPADYGSRIGEHIFNGTPMPGYTPYTYPHPLTKGLPPPGQTTQNATPNSQDERHKKRRPWGGKKPERKEAKKANESPANEMPEGQENPGK